MTKKQHSAASMPSSESPTPSRNAEASQQEDLPLEGSARAARQEREPEQSPTPTSKAGAGSKKKKDIKSSYMLSPENGALRDHSRVKKTRKEERLEDGQGQASQRTADSKRGLRRPSNKSVKTNQSSEDAKQSPKPKRSGATGLHRPKEGRPKSARLREPPSEPTVTSKEAVEEQKEEEHPREEEEKEEEVVVLGEGETETAASGRGTHTVVALAVARAITGESARNVIGEARPLNIDEAEQRRKHMQFRIAICTMIGIILILAVAVPAIILGRRNKKVISEGPRPDHSEDLAGLSTTPSAFIESLPESTRIALGNESTPQSKAYYGWLVSHPQISTMQEWRQKQLLALVSFYYAFDGDNWPMEIYGASWLMYSHECNWFTAGDHQGIPGYGVPTCSVNNYYTDLSLELNGVTGTMPAEIAFLTSLEVLFLSGLSDTNFSVVLEPLIEIPYLERLGLPENSFEGQLPAEIGELRSLEWLQLNDNAFTGSVPNNLLVGLTGLRILELQNNMLKGTMPPQIGMLKFLTELRLNSNSISGSLPSELGLVDYLHLLDLSMNEFSNRIPSELGLLTGLDILKISQNFLSGSIFTEIGLLEELKELNLGQNSISGRIPSEIGLLKQLELLNLSGNALSGPIPSELGNLDFHTTNISILPGNVTGLVNASLVPTSAFTGTLPSELCPWFCASINDIKTLSGFLEVDCSSTLQCTCDCAQFYGNCDADISPFGGELDVSSARELMCPFKGTTHQVVINIHPDNYPSPIDWALLRMDAPFSPQSGISPYAQWTLVSSYTMSRARNGMFAFHEKNLSASTLYRFQMSDAPNDGACCGNGVNSFVIITNSTSIVWSQPRYLYFGVYMFFWVDANGHTALLDSGLLSGSGGADPDVGTSSDAGIPADSTSSIALCSMIPCMLLSLWFLLHLQI